MTDEENKELWESYFYPNTRVLINNLNIKESNKLKEKEATHTFEKLILLSKEPINIDIDKKRLNYIHKYLFEEIYPFAGEYRKVNMQKVGGVGGFLFSDNPKDIPQVIDASLDKLFKEINQMLKRCYDIHGFCDILAKLYTTLIYIHPYREGNGRTIRELLREFSIKKSKELGIGELELDWSLIDKEELNEFIDVVHMFPYSISSIFMNALVSRENPKNR